MQQELSDKGYDMSILGINKIGLEASNDVMTEGRDIPWLQDVPTVEMWSKWGVHYRDVLIFDETLMLQKVINLSQNNLIDTDNYDDFFTTITTL